MEASRIKKYLVILLIIIGLISCNNKGSKMEIIAYGTLEFKEFVRTAPISLDKAWDKQLKYYAKQGKKEVGSPLFFIVDKKYLFSPYYNPKIPEVRLEGVAVDSQTGEVSYIKENKKLRPKSQFGWYKETK